jgi:Ca-activated chloride channel family protein
MILALAGPAYKIKPNIESNEQSEVVWVLKVTPSMMTKDLLPSRIKRAVFKIDDFLSLRSDIRSALVAYAGSAHLVMPLTKDKKIINAFVSSLEPSMMPRRGEALYDAVKLASKQFIEVKGSIIVLCDGVSEDALQKIKEDKDLDGFNIIYYNITSEAMRSERMASAIQLSIDKSDIEALSSAVDYQFNNALAAKAGRYENSGYTLLPFMIALMLLFFQRGFMGELWRRK